MHASMVHRRIVVLLGMNSLIKSFPDFQVHAFPFFVEFDNISSRTRRQVNCCCA